MKIKTDIRLLAVLGIVGVLTISPISYSVFAQNNSEDNDKSNNDKDDKRKLQKELRKEKLREIKNIALKNRLETKPKVFDEMRSHEPDRQPDLSFRSETSGWTVVGDLAHKSSISLSGHAFKTDERIWKISTIGEITVGDRKAKLDLKGITTGHKIMLQGSGMLQNGEEVRLTLVGHYAPTSEDGVFAIAFTNGMFHNTNTGERLTMMQVGSVHVEPLVSTPEPSDEDEIEGELQQ